MNWRRHGLFLLRGKMYNMEDVLKCDGWTSCQSLLEETVEDEKINLARNPLIERRVSYKKALEQARKIYPDFFSTKTYKTEPNIQVGPEENEAIELDEFPISGDKSNSTAAKIKVAEQLQSRGETTNSTKCPIFVKSFNFDKKKKDQSEIERGLLHILFRPARVV